MMEAWMHLLTLMIAVDSRLEIYLMERSRRNNGERVAAFGWTRLFGRRLRLKVGMRESLWQRRRGLSFFSYRKIYPICQKVRCSMLRLFPRFFSSGLCLALSSTLLTCSGISIRGFISVSVRNKRDDSGLFDRLNCAMTKTFVSNGSQYLRRRWTEEWQARRLSFRSWPR